MSNILVRKYREDDLASILRIEKDSFNDAWDENSLKGELNENPFANILVAISGDEVVGFIDYLITFNSATIVQIAVKKEFRRQGIGELLVQSMFNEIKNFNSSLNTETIDDYIESLTLEVRENNIPAINLYKKVGFKDITIKKNYYKDGENAIYMGTWF